MYTVYRLYGALYDVHTMYTAYRLYGALYDVHTMYTVYRMYGALYDVHTMYTVYRLYGALYDVHTMYTVYRLYGALYDVDVSPFSPLQELQLLFQTAHPPQQKTTHRNKRDDDHLLKTNRKGKLKPCPWKS